MPGTLARAARVVRVTAMRLKHAPNWFEGTLLALLWAIVLIRVISAHWP
jgi:hypothetical protein